MMDKSSTKNIRWGVLLSYGELVIALIGSLFVSNRVLRYIGDYNYGLYSFVGSITSWLTVLSSALVSSYIRFAAVDAKERGNINKTNSLFIKILSTFGMLIIFLGTVIIGFLCVKKVEFADYSWNDSLVIYMLFLFSIINIGITFITTIFTQYIHYNQKFIYEKSLAIASSVLGFVAHFLIAKYTKSIVILSIYSVIATVCTFLCNFWFCKRNINIQFEPVQLRKERMILTSIISFSSILVINSVVDQINNNVDKTLLGLYSVPEDITMYQMGQLFHTYLASVVTAVSGVFAPRVYDLCAHGNQKEVNSLFTKVSRLQGLIVCFVAFGFVSCGEVFIKWWLGDNYTAAYHVGAVLMLLSIMPLSVKLAIDIQRAKNLHKFRSFLFLAVAIFNIALSVFFLNVLPKKFAIYACLLGTIISNIICQWICMNVYNAKVIKLPMRAHLLQLSKYILYGCFGFLAVMLFNNYFLSNWHLPSLICFFCEGAVYVLCYLILILISDRKFVLSFLKR